MPSPTSDIIPCILDFIQDDRPSVLACSLVSTEWLQHARKHIFRSISITSPDAWRTLVRMLSANILLRPHVRSLRLTCNLPIHELDPSETGALCPQLEFISLNGSLAQLHILHCFPHVHTLSVSPLKGVQRSHIGASPAVCLRHIRVIASDMITSLTLDWIDRTPTREAQTLKEASFSVGVSSESRSWLHHARMNLFIGRYNSLRSLNLYLAAVWSVPTTEFRLVAPLIERLHISVEANAYGAAQSFTLLRESELSNLRRLTIRFERIAHHSQKGILKPYKVMGNTVGIDWQLPSSLARNLEKVVLSLPNIRKMEGGGKLVRLLGEAGSPAVLRVESDGVVWPMNGSWEA